ncbi:hypothetical protein D3C71_1906910 [compost metagenome]
MLEPVDLQHAFVEAFGVLDREAPEHQQYPVGQARPQAQAISRLHPGDAPDGGRMLARLLEPQVAGFLEQQAFQALGAGEKEFVTIRHGNIQCLRQ